MEWKLRVNILQGRTPCVKTCRQFPTEGTLAIPSQTTYTFPLACDPALPVPGADPQIDLQMCEATHV